MVSGKSQHDNQWFECSYTAPVRTEFTPTSYLFFWLTLAILSFTYIWTHGTLYVNWPRLNAPYKILEYQGPGFKSGMQGRGWAQAWETLRRRALGRRGHRKAAAAEIGSEAGVSGGSSGISAAAGSAGTGGGVAAAVELGRRKGNLID